MMHGLRSAPLLTTLFILVGLLVLPHAESAVAPLSPGPGDVYRAGGACFISWNTDQTGTWKNMTIELMSGPNLNQSIVSTVVYGLDGTSASNHDWTCPYVSPYSNIYFYRFSNGMDRDHAAWTTRFTIESSSGVATPPEYSRQPDGAHVPWGNGHVVAHPTSAKAPSKLGLDSASTCAEKPKQTESHGFLERDTHVIAESKRDGQRIKRAADPSEIQERRVSTSHPLATAVSKGDRHSVIPSLYLICALCVFWALI
ncbi:hypothetical protein F5I97DRAFT_1862150 [Phlebopus sp. FC_14]|nr:hypothetical protein F5I97DRAFT_1862150 [Phlebopus sp. FC_14]